MEGDLRALIQGRCERRTFFAEHPEEFVGPEGPHKRRMDRYQSGRKWGATRKSKCKNGE